MSLHYDIKYGAVLFIEDSKKQQGRPQSPLSMSTEHKYEHDNQALSLQVESLQAQIQDQARLAKEQVIFFPPLSFTAFPSLPQLNTVLTFPIEAASKYPSAI